jgi:hypothetical protein
MPCDGVGVVNNENNTVDSDGCEESPPCLPRGDLRSKGVTVGLYELRDFVIGLDCGADEIPCGVHAHCGVGKRETSEDTHEADDGHVVREGVQGDVRG